MQAKGLARDRTENQAGRVRKHAAGFFEPFFGLAQSRKWCQVVHRARAVSRVKEPADLRLVVGLWGLGKDVWRVGDSAVRRIERLDLAEGE